MKFRVKHIFRTFVITLLFSGLTLAVSAQKKNLTHQSLYFLCYYGSYHISPAWGVTLEVENRRFFHRSRDLNWILPRLGVVRSLGKGWSAGAGFTYYRSYNPADPAKAVAVSVPELRPH